MGNNGNDTPGGGAGDDSINGGAGNDVFVFDNNFGVDVIHGFNNGDDKIDLSGVSSLDDYTDLMTTHLSNNSSGHAVITDGDNTITLTGVPMDNLDANDFMF